MDSLSALCLLTHSSRLFELKLHFDFGHLKFALFIYWDPLNRDFSVVCVVSTRAIMSWGRKNWHVSYFDEDRVKSSLRSWRRRRAQYPYPRWRSITSTHTDNIDTVFRRHTYFNSLAFQDPISFFFFFFQGEKMRPKNSELRFTRGFFSARKLLTW